MRQTERPRAVATSRCLPFFGMVSLLLCAVTLAAPAARSDDAVARRASAQAQFARAEALRAELEAKPERQRSIKDYQQLITAYRRVYLITPRAAEVPTALRQVGDLYRTMGEQFEATYFDSAVETYEFLLHEYPTSRYREEALLAIAAIQRNNLAQTNLAQKSYEDFLRQYPHATHADEARKALDEIAATEKIGTRGQTPETSAGAASPSSPAVTGNPGEASSDVGQVRVWNADTYTRIIIPLGGQAKYQAARISDPDRIYFDIEGAKLSPKLIHDPVEVPSGGYLKTARIAQNRPDVVRVVLEVTKVKDYSVFELANPDRLVVDVYGPAAAVAATASSPAGRSANAADSEPTRTSVAPRKPAKSADATLGARADSATSNAPANASDSPASTASARPTPASIRNVKASRTAATALPTITTEGVPNASVKKAAEAMGPPPVPEPTHAGERSLTRALGLKIGRIVIDAGHGGHDTGTIGATGLMEKDLCLDLALRLGKLIEERLPAADVVYTRSDDTFIPLEQRTAIANNSKADLFLSIHANSSEDRKVSGIETYYLNFNASPAAMEVAARENALSQSGVHNLQDMVQKIARNEKIEESRDFATDIQDSLAKRTDHAGTSERNRGVRKAPFVVLIGADMPSVLAEVSFLSNPTDEQWLKKPENRQRLAEGLYHGIENYLHSTNSLASNVAPSAGRSMAVARSGDR